MSDIAEGEYIVFQHGSFDFETENLAVEAKIEEAMKTLTGQKQDTSWTQRLAVFSTFTTIQNASGNTFAR